MQYQIDVIVAMAERTIKRLWILIILLVVLLFGSNAAWLWYESSFTDERTVQEIWQEAEADNGSDIRLVGGDYYGNGEAENTNDNDQTSP